MTTYLLDTNACIESLRAKGHAGLKARLASEPPVNIRLCAINLAELYHGAEKSADPAGERAKVDGFAVPFVCLPFDDAAAIHYGSIRAHLEARGTPIGPLDTQIAAIARAHGLTLVTHNTAEFGRVPGLALADWQTP